MRYLLLTLLWLALTGCATPSSEREPLEPKPTACTRGTGEHCTTY